MNILNQLLNEVVRCLLKHSAILLIILSIYLMKKETLKSEIYLGIPTTK